MDEFVNALRSPFWWLSVVVVGIAVNLLSAYLKQRLDSRLTAVSSWWERRSALQRGARQKEVEQLASSPHLQVFEYIAGVRMLVMATLSLICGIFVILFGGALSGMLFPGAVPNVVIVIQNSIAAACMFVSFLLVRGADRLRKIAEDARLITRDQDSVKKTIA
jgi:hypothetical protein